MDNLLGKCTNSQLSIKHSTREPLNMSVFICKMKKIRRNSEATEETKPVSVEEKGMESVSSSTRGKGELPVRFQGMNCGDLKTFDLKAGPMRSNTKCRKRNDKGSTSTKVTSDLSKRVQSASTTPGRPNITMSRRPKTGIDTSRTTSQDIEMTLLPRLQNMDLENSKGDSLESSSHGSQLDTEIAGLDRACEVYWLLCFCLLLKFSLGCQF